MYPCLICYAKTKQALCNDCLKVLPPPCTEPMPYDDYETVIACTTYTPIMRPIVQALKHLTPIHIVKTLASWMASQCQGLPQCYIIPMPDHRSTLYQKGGFPIGMLAKEIAHCLNWPLDLTSVIKHRATKSQKSCDQHDRAHNVEGAFLYQGKHSETDCLLILDDVITTGHSMHAMAMAIHEIRPIRLYGLCLTRAVYTSL